MEKEIVFVDGNDTVIGAGSMREAQEKGIRHRIARIFLLDSHGNVLVAKRAPHLHSQPGKWGESVSGHVDKGEGYYEAALREMQEEIGVTGIALRELGKFYSEGTERDMIKNRFNTVYEGTYEGTCSPNEEVAEVRWLPKPALAQWMREKPEEFTQASIRAFEYLQS